MENLLSKYSFDRITDPSWIVGQKDTMQILKNIVKTSLDSVAVMLVAPWGCGKSALAKYYAKLCVCQSRTVNNDPCLVCSDCLSVDMLQRTFYGAFSSATIHNARTELFYCDCSKMLVDDYKYLFKCLNQPSFFSESNMVIMEESQRASPQIRDMFLLEIERYRNIKWVFNVAQDGIGNVEDSLKQRTLMLHLRIPSEKEIVELLGKICKRENIAVEEAVLEIIAQYSDCRPRLSIQNLQKIILSGCAFIPDEVENILKAGR